VAPQIFDDVLTVLNFFRFSRQGRKKTSQSIKIVRRPDTCSQPFTYHLAALLPFAMPPSESATHHLPPCCSSPLCNASRQKPQQPNAYFRYSNCAPTPYQCGPLHFNIGHPFSIGGRCGPAELLLGPRAPPVLQERRQAGARHGQRQLRRVPVHGSRLRQPPPHRHRPAAS
jgi:hypothetical protein